MTWGATLIVTQAEDWGVSINYSATSMNYGILLQGFGGIFAVPFIEAYGRYILFPRCSKSQRLIIRLPIWFWTQVVTMFMVLGATFSTSYPVFTTFRSLQGLFGTVPQVVGLSIIHDMYDPKDWPRMINIWYALSNLCQMVFNSLKKTIQGNGIPSRTLFRARNSRLPTSRKPVSLDCIVRCLDCSLWLVDCIDYVLRLRDLLPPRRRNLSS